MEKWYELPDIKNYEVYKGNHFIDFDDDSPASYGVFRGTSFADAVSKAYEAWKKGEGE